MSEPVIVRGEIPSSLFWSRIVVPLCLAGTVSVLLFGDRGVGICLTAVAGLLWIGLETYAAILRSKQLWVRDTGDGFEVIDRREAYHVPDDSITSLAVKSKRNYSGGTLTSVYRKFMIWSNEYESDDPITLESTLQEKKPDPLGPLTARLWGQVLERAKSRLHEGLAFVGDGWRLDSNDFSWGQGPNQQAVPCKNISACEEFDGQICVWKKGQDDAVAKFPTAGRNVCLLPLLLTPAETPADAQDGESSTGLGRILFERKPRLATRMIAHAGGGLMAFIGLILLVGVPEIGAKLAGLAFGAGGVAIVVWAYSMAYTVFRCRERGVNKSGLFGQQELRYVDVETFTYSATRHYHNGVYCGTHVGLHFIPRPDLKAPKINYTTTIMNEDAALDELRTFIARAIAARMAARLEAGEPVTWTKNLTFLPAGIQYRPAGFIGRKEMQLLTPAEYGGCNMDQGVFYLFRQGNKKAVLTEQVSAPNFFPGFCLLMMMHQE